MSKRKFTSSIAVVVVICLAAVFVFDCFAQSDPAADIHSGPRVLEVSSIGCGIGPDPENTNCGAAGLVSVILSNNHGGLVAPGQTPAQAIPFVSQWVFSTAKVNGPAHEAPYSALELFYAYNAIVTQFSPGECVEVKRVGVQADDGSWPPMTDTPSVKETNLSGVHISHVLGKYPGVEDFIDAFDNGASISVSIHTYGDPSNQVVGYHAL
ncbi:MAG: hypothetical protein KDD53_10040, partial [Bdellovibrionales bacterium]|nr:hypothetical protein [Bdellovibrionales bacterium]